MATDPRFESNIKRVEHRSALDSEIAEILRQLTRDDLIERLRAAKITYGALNSVEDLDAHPQLRKVTVETPHGALEMPAPPAILAGEDQQPGPVPGLNQQGAALREEFGA